ncbi:unnamed protein product [Prorocentrum cordatum]|uniref:Uncharacterized protein n=1 Tax=Prorocentrum cordatum TaxID=2364126 RepID=A0ABN9X6J5_9DINO|nr:unnamed protein product [Polarella glacialis]
MTSAFKPMDVYFSYRPSMQEGRFFIASMISRFCAKRFVSVARTFRFSTCSKRVAFVRPMAVAAGSERQTGTLARDPQGSRKGLPDVGQGAQAWAEVASQTAEAEANYHPLVPRHRNATRRPTLQETPCGIIPASAETGVAQVVMSVR